MQRGYPWGLIAVAFWSTSATVAGLLQGHANYIQIATLMQIAALATLIIIAVPSSRTFLKELGTGLFKHPLTFIPLIVLFSATITIYQLSFYYALQHAPHIQANIINYLWPLLLFISGSTIFGISRERPGVYEIALIVLAFFGAFTIAWDQTVTLSSFTLTPGLIVAFFAAIAAPIYMNTSVLIVRRFFSKPHFVYLTGFAISLPVLIAYTNYTGTILAPDPTAYPLTTYLGVFSVTAYPLIIYLGVFTVALAHVSWTRAIHLGPSVTVSNLAYLVPVFSTLLLVAILKDHASNKIIFGATLIILSNVLSNEAFRRVYAESGAMIVFFYVSFSIYFKNELGLQKLVFGSLEYLGTIFAIISGFFLARMWEKNRDEQKTIVKFSTELDGIIKDIRERHSVTDTQIDNAVDLVMTAVADFDVARTDSDQAGAAEKLKDAFNQLIIAIEQSVPLEGVQARFHVIDATLKLRGLLNSWIIQKFDKASTGELAIVAILGLMGVIFVITGSEDKFLLDLIAMAFSACIAYIVLKIRDYNNMVAISDYARLLIIQAPLKRIGRPYYLADRALLYNKFKPDKLGAEIRVRDRHTGVVTSTREIPGRDVQQYRQSRNFLVVSLCVGVMAVLLLLFDKYYHIVH